MKSMDEKTKLSARAAALRRFNSWKSKHHHNIGAEEALAGVGTLYDFMPPESRRRVFNPEGLTRMRHALSYLKGSS